MSELNGFSWEHLTLINHILQSLNSGRVVVSVLGPEWNNFGVARSCASLLMLSPSNMQEGGGSMVAPAGPRHT
jgi:hypothetical protein